MESNYANIHCHDALGSIRDSILRIEEYLVKCIELNITPGLSNHGNLASAYKFYKECKKHGVKKFTLGQEFYYEDGNEENKQNYHLVVIAKNNEGYKNLCKLSSAAFINNFYKKPRINKAMLFENSNGLIVTTACLQGHFQQLILEEKIDLANKEIDDFYKHFKEDFYLEVHNHNIPEEEIIRNYFRNYGNENGIKIIAGCDTHFLNKNDKQTHNIFKQISYNSIGKDGDADFDGDGYHVMDLKEMKERFLENEITNTLEIADKCNISIEFKKYYTPKFSTEITFDSFDYLKNMCYAELKKKNLFKEEYVNRLEYELNLLHLSNLEDYLLVVSDYCLWAKNNDIPVGPGRGSMGGSIVAWLTGITNIDPIKYDLSFVRAINPGRVMQYDFGV